MAQDCIKRINDILASSLILVLVSPLMMVIYLVLSFKEEGTAIFSQERVGLYGKVFRIYKFRTMSLDAENDGVLLSHSSGKNDDRVMKTGRFIRSSHLDELPQLWNVLRGDMSLVGYRPERKIFIDKIMERDSRYERLYAMRPGVTSYATIYNGYTDTMEKMLKRLEMDLEYLEHHSFLIDLKIIILTVAKIVSGKKI